MCFHVTFAVHIGLTEYTNMDLVPLGIIFKFKGNHVQCDIEHLLYLFVLYPFLNLVALYFLFQHCALVSQIE